MSLISCPCQNSPFGVVLLCWVLTHFISSSAFNSNCLLLPHCNGWMRYLFVGGHISFLGDTVKCDNIQFIHCDIILILQTH